MAAPFLLAFLLLLVVLRRFLSAPRVARDVLTLPCMPLDVLLAISKELSPCDALCLALNNKALYSTLRFWIPKHLDYNDELQLIGRLYKDAAGALYICFACRKLREKTRTRTVGRWKHCQCFHRRDVSEMRLTYATHLTRFVFTFRQAHDIMVHHMHRNRHSTQLNTSDIFQLGVFRSLTLKQAILRASGVNIDTHGPLIPGRRWRISWRQQWEGRIIDDELFLCSTTWIVHYDWDLFFALLGHVGLSLCSHHHVTEQSGWDWELDEQRENFPGGPYEQVRSCDSCLSDYSLRIIRRLVHGRMGWKLIFKTYTRLGRLRSEWHPYWYNWAPSTCTYWQTLPDGLDLAAKDLDRFRRDSAFTYSRNAMIAWDERADRLAVRARWIDAIQEDEAAGSYYPFGVVWDGIIPASGPEVNYELIKLQSRRVGLQTRVRRLSV